MKESLDLADRRRFLGAAAMTLAAATCRAASASHELGAFDRAPTWLNTPRLTAASLQGKVVLVEFWTYTCINWLRTLPYVRAWSEKYRDRFVVIGVHTPEFPFEHDEENVRRAVKRMNISYPVVVDNDYGIWRAFDNNYWPALYFLDARGRVRHHQFGEGQYDESERMIQRLLVEAGVPAVDQNIVSIEPSGAEAQADWANLRSEETYLRSNATAFKRWSTAGKWTIGRDSIVSTTPDGRVMYRFHARDLHMVLGPATRDTTIRFRVTLDGRPPGPARGIDVDEQGGGTVNEQRLYQLIRQPKPIVDREFAIEFLDAGAEAFDFTFG